MTHILAEMPIPARVIVSENGEHKAPDRGILTAPNEESTMKYASRIGLAIALAIAASNGFAATADEQRVAALDTEYQAAVLHKDVAAMKRLLADDFVLVTGKGKAYTKADLLKDTARPELVFTHQEDTQQTVRIWGDTAVVTALLHVAGADKGQAFDYSLWFSDVYLRTSKGWRYTFGQASIRLPTDAPKSQ
jgi:ketosteroid isomerase-like protein